jgi:hypothetical protein
VTARRRQALPKHSEQGVRVQPVGSEQAHVRIIVQQSSEAMLTKESIAKSTTRSLSLNFGRSDADRCVFDEYNAAHHAFFGRISVDPFQSDSPY